MKIDEDGVNKYSLANNESGSVYTKNDVAAYTFDVEAGKTYIAYATGTGDEFYGIYFEPASSSTHKLSGTVNYTGTATTTGWKLVFTNAKDNEVQKVDFGTTYSIDATQNRTYDITLEDADGNAPAGTTIMLDTNSAYVGKTDVTYNINVVDVAVGEVTGSVKVHDINNDNQTLDLSQVTFTFTDKNDSETTYTSSAIANDGSYTVNLMSGRTYTVTATGATGYDLSPLSGEYTYVAGDPTPFKNILFTETLGTVEFAATVKVGADKPYKTISDAITAIKKMTRPAGEDGRVTIEIDPGTYTEQVYLDANYVTLKAANEAQKPTIQFYYGIGYIYYSSNSGYYSEDYAVAKTRKSTVDRWGAVCRVYGEHVNLENIIFKNTFSCEITDAELADGVEAAKNNEYSDVNNKPERDTENYDPKTKTAVERAAAIAIDKNYCEAYGCEFISSQDTFFTNSIAYIKDCYIEGATDYIFGGNSVVFDGCTLAWHGYSDQATGGYLTANKNSNAGDNGYLLKNSTVTNSKYYPQNKFAAGSWGRNWGGANCQVVFDGVTMSGADLPGAWVKMGGELSTSTLFVNNVTDKTGVAVDVSGTAYNPNGTMTANNYTEMKPEDYFGGTWTPPHYVASTEPDDPKPDDPEPSTDPEIKTAEKKDGNTYVTLANIESGVVIAVKYNGAAVDSVKTANVNTADAETGVITINGIEADKVMVWNSLEEMEPVCEAKAVTAATSGEPQPPEEPDDTVTVTVTQPTGGTVTVYNESKFHSSTADIPAGVTANQQLADNDYYTLTAPALIENNKTDNSGVFADNSNMSTNYFEIRNNGTKQIKYAAKADGVLTMYLMFVDHKLITCENKTDNTTATKYINNTTVAGTTQANQYAAVTFDVKDCKSYELYTNGGTGRLFGVKYESTDYPQSTTSLVVDKGDTVRAAVVPAANYVVDGITVDGEKHTGREYTFTVNADTTVSATLEAEPALVENTAVASDAALTREVMGAILYDAYNLASADTKTNMAKYIAQNGGVPSPDDPNYDPNLTYEGTPYTPLTGWGALTDKNDLDDSLYAKVKAAYNLGLIRTETGIARSSAANGTELEPDAEVTRAKAAKSLVFAWSLTQDPGKASQKIPAGFAPQAAAAIAAPNNEAQSTVFTNTVTPASVQTASVSLASADEEATANTDNAEFNLMSNDAITVDFTALSEVPVYTAENGKGFVAKSSAIMPSGREREVAPVSSITIDATDGAKVTESDGAYLTAKKS
ncbi:MAG: hypothetical protein IJG06_02835, partial [Clostridia bacterium]|nr:hypothetical protein [Clostridia bacterium]